MISKCVKGLFIKEGSVCTSHHIPLDNILKSNNLVRAVVPGDKNCCLYEFLGV